MRAHFGLPSVEAEDKEGKPPISVKFEIPYFTTSGIQVTKCYKWYFMAFSPGFLSSIMRGIIFFALLSCNLDVIV